MIWPMDPYYEQLLKHSGKTKKRGRRRQEFNAEVLTTFKTPSRLRKNQGISWRLG